MRCEACFGIGEVLVDEHGVIVTRLRDAVMMVPCGVCGGCGLAHCCEGERPDDAQKTPGIIKSQFPKINSVR